MSMRRPDPHAPALAGEQHTSTQQVVQVAILQDEAAGYWTYEVFLDGRIVGGGAGHADPVEALQAARHAFSGSRVQLVVQQDCGAAPGRTTDLIRSA